MSYVRLRTVTGQVTVVPLGSVDFVSQDPAAEETVVYLKSGRTLTFGGVDSTSIADSFCDALTATPGGES